MKKYLMGVFAIALAVGFSAFTVAKKFDNVFKITGQSTLNGSTIFLTDDANTDVVSDCGTDSDKCKITTTLSAPHQTGTAPNIIYYFNATGDGTYSVGTFQ